MRCEYCVYCEKYPKEIGYTNEDMNFDNAIKAFDLYLKLHNEKLSHGYKKEPMVNFYGGEPLLKFDLIKKIVKYIIKIEPETRFYITTNGLLLTAEIADFIADHNFSVTFSLDGYKENHDRNRVTIGGAPTFDLLMHNIEQLQKIKLKKGIVQTISFNCCFDNYMDLEKANEFFVKHYETFSPFFTMYNQINPYDNSYYEWAKAYAEKSDLKLNPDAFNISYKKIKKQIIENEITDFEREINMNLFLSSMILHFRNKWVGSVFNNSCVPLSKIAVYPSGEICLCEKMNKKLIVGNIHSGIDEEKLKKYVNVLKEQFSTGKCSKCIAKKICPACFMYLNENGEYNIDFCNNQVSTLKGKLSELYEILEINPNFFETMKMTEEYAEMIEVNS